MPDRLSYDEAMQYARHTLKIQEPEIKQGAVETYAVKTAAGEMKKPWGREGGFAVVYKFRTLSGQLKAMRCFRVAMASDIQRRYEAMNRYFRQHVPDITIDFRYHEEGILVKESAQNSQKKVCPVIVMDWIEGTTLLDKVDELCRKRDRQALTTLSTQWLAILQKMRQARMAHGDLAALNVMIDDNNRMVLIDYDGVYIPEFSALPQVVLGQQGYQHPDMLNRPFNEHMDDFSALVLYLSLLALQLQPELWDKHAKRNPKGQLDGNMLFNGDDFAQPDKSPIFHELAHSSHAQVRELAQKLMACCKGPVTQARFPVELLDPEHAIKLELQQLENALVQQNDEAILRLWREPLASYGPAQVHLPRVTESRQRAAALAELRRAFGSRDLFGIADAASKVSMPHLSTQERTMIQLAGNFARAFQSDDDEQMLNRWEEIEFGPFRALLSIGPAHQQRLELARQRKAALTRFRVACLHSHNAHEILNAYTPELDRNPAVSAQERALLEAAKRYVLMYDAIKDALTVNYGRGDLAGLEASYDEELDQRFNDFTPMERARIAGLRNMGKLERALNTKAYRLALVTAKEIEQQTRAPINDERLSLARMHFVKAFEPRNLQIYLQAGQAIARWDWPGDEMIGIAVLAWRPDRWPLHPRKDDEGRVLLRVNRGFYEQYNGFQFAIGSAQQIYAQVFFALSEIVEFTNEQHWFYSRGLEPSAKWPRPT